MNSISDVDKAYIAGFVDGEGCIGYYNASKSTPHRPGYFHASVNVCNTDPDVISWLANVTGIGKCRITRPKGNRRPAYQWQIAKKADVIEFLEVISPYLKVKQNQAKILLAHFTIESDYIKKHGSVTEDIVMRRQEIADKLKTLKKATVEGVETVQAESYSIN